MDKLKFAIIGCGRISHKHIEAIVNNKEAELVAVSDIIPEKMDNAIENHCRLINNNGKCLKEIKRYTDYNKMLAKEDIDVVTISTASGYHSKQAINCLNKKKYVLVEKPMALSIKDADEMIQTAKKNGVKLCVCYQNRFNSSIQNLRKAIEEGRFGKLINGTARILWNRNDDYYKQESWRGTWKLDGGTLMNQCIHSIDLLQWMMGAEVESIYAQTETFLRNIEGEDFGAIIIRFKNKSIGIVEGSTCVYPKNLESTLSIFGEKGTVVIGGLGVNKVEVWRFEDGLDSEEILLSQKEETNSVFSYEHTLLFKDFINAIREDREPLINGEEGKKALEIVLGAYKSQLIGEKVEFPLGYMDTVKFMEIK